MHFYSKVIFVLIFVIEKIYIYIYFFFFFFFFLLFFAEVELLIFHNNILKISEKIEPAELVDSLPPSYLQMSA